MLPLFFGLLSTVGAAILTVALAAYSRQYLHALSPAFIPFGALMLGSLCAAGYYGGLFVSGWRARRTHYIAAAFLGILGFAAVNYTIYRTAYIDVEQRVNHRFRGRHISQLFADGRRERFTWPVFFAHEARRRKPSLDGLTTLTEVPNPPRRKLPLTAGQRALLGVEFMAFPAGALLVGLLVMLDRVHCARCQRYLRERYLFSLPLEGLDASIRRLNHAITIDPDSVIALGTRGPATIAGSHVKISLLHCLGCSSGFLVLRFMKQTTLDQSVEHDRQSVRLPGRFAGDLAERAPSESV